MLPICHLLLSVGCQTMKEEDCLALATRGAATATALGEAERMATGARTTGAEAKAMADMVLKFRTGCRR